MSAYMPPTADTALDAHRPHTKRKNMNADQLVADALAMVKTVKMPNGSIITIRRPYVSLNGPRRRASQTKPTGYTEIGSTNCVLLVTLKYAAR